MKKLIYVLPILLMLPFFSGCKNNNIQTWNNEWYINCTAEEKSSESCNMVYSPVCGDDGETYWNSCVACSSQKINAYKIWECNCNAENWICTTSDDEENISADSELLDNLDVDTQDENTLQDQDIEDSITDVQGTIIEVPEPSF